MDLALNNLQRFICHETHPTNQPTKGKVEQSREKSSALPYIYVLAIERGAFWSPLTKAANFTFYLLITITAKLILIPSGGTC